MHLVLYRQCNLEIPNRKYVRVLQCFQYWVEKINNSQSMSDIYVLKCWVVLSFNSRVTLNFFLFWNCRLQNLTVQKNLRLDCHLSTYLFGLKTTIFTLEIVLNFNANLKQEKVEDCPWVVTFQLNNWAHKCQYGFRIMRFLRRWILRCYSL